MMVNFRVFAPLDNKALKKHSYSFKKASQTHPRGSGKNPDDFCYGNWSNSLPRGHPGEKEKGKTTSILQNAGDARIMIHRCGKYLPILFTRQIRFGKQLPHRSLPALTGSRNSILLLECLLPLII